MRKTSRLLTSTRYTRRVYAASWSVVTLQLVPLPSRTPFTLPLCLRGERSRRGREGAQTLHLPPPSRSLSFSPSLFHRASPLTHAMINITLQSYGIQTDLETDFFLLKASPCGAATVQLPSPETFLAREIEKSEKLKPGVAAPIVWITLETSSSRNYLFFVAKFLFLVG